MDLPNVKRETTMSAINIILEYDSFKASLFHKLRIRSKCLYSALFRDRYPTKELYVQSPLLFIYRNARPYFLS
jgi:hypothetical protein